MIVKKFTLKVATIFDYASRIVCFVLMLLIFVNVVMRAVNMPIRGTIEFVEFFNAMTIGLALAYCGARGGHIFVTFLYEKFKGKLQLIVDIVIDLISLAFLSLSSYRLFIYGATMQSQGQVSMTTMTPYYPFVYVVSIGFIAYCLVLLGDIIYNCVKVVKR